jgi:hypothetical protein
MFERRDSVRVRPAMREPIEVQFVAAGMLDIVHAVDVSERGIALRLNMRVDPRMIGTQVDLVVNLPGFAPFHTKGVIRRVSPSDGYIVGIKFLALPPKGVESIHTYIEHRLDARSSARMRISG